MTPIAFEEFREAWLGDVREGNPSTIELGHRFAHKILTQWLDIGSASDDLVYCDGSGDGGIDIAYLDRSDIPEGEGEGVPEGDTWYLVQSKYGTAFQGQDTLLKEGRKVIDTLDGQRHLSSLAEGLLDRLSIFRRQASERDHIVLVFATERPLTEGEKQTLADVRTLGRSRLGSIFDVEAISIETIYLRTLDDTTAAGFEHIRVPLRASLVPSGADLQVGSVTLLNLYEFLKTYRATTDNLDELYEKNVRRFLGSRGKVNRAMQDTLQREPALFGLYNNGITIVVTDFKPISDGTYELVEPYIVNGCQTTRTIWEVFHRRLEAGGTGSDPANAAWRRSASEGVVVTKIVKVGSAGEALLQNITRYTNSQNAVREKDFLTLTSDLHNWARQMAEQYGVYLEVQRGGWDSQRAFQRQNPDTRQFTEPANAFDLLKVYGSGWLHEAGLAFGKNPPFLPGGAIFKRIVNNEDGGDPFGVDDLYAAYRLQTIADNYQFGRGASRQSRRQTRYLFYMVVLDLLADILTRAGQSDSPKSLTRSMLKLVDPIHKDALQVLTDAAIDIIDEYLTQGAEDSVFVEPAFQNTYNSDLNSFLKWEKIGKDEVATPRFRSLLAVTKRSLSRGRTGQLSPRDLITTAILG